jgi:3-hydroxybutyryl-CoA dehydrogenase
LPITVAIIGAGPLGRWLALAAARAGYCVYLEDVMPANLHHAQEYLRTELGPEALGGSGFRGLKSETWGTRQPPTLAAKTKARRGWGTEFAGVQFVSTIEDAVREADLAIDCVPDELESKLEIFCLLDRMAPPRTVLATPTMRLSIADLAACTYRADKCVAIVAEAASLAGDAGREVLLRTTSKTSAETADLVRSFWERLGFAARVECDPDELSLGG